MLCYNVNCTYDSQSHHCHQHSHMQHRSGTVWADRHRYSYIGTGWLSSFEGDNQSHPYLLTSKSHLSVLLSIVDVNVLLYMYDIYYNFDLIASVKLIFNGIRSCHWKFQKKGLSDEIINMPIGTDDDWPFNITIQCENKHHIMMYRSINSRLICMNIKGNCYKLLRFTNAC